MNEYPNNLQVYNQPRRGCGSVFLGILAGIGIIGRYWLLPLLETALPSASAAKAVTLAVIYLGMALFIRPMLDTRSPQYTVLWMKKRSFGRKS